jgi:hypothetical protein
MTVTELCNQRLFVIYRHSASTRLIKRLPMRSAQRRTDGVELSVPEWPKPTAKSDFCVEFAFAAEFMSVWR